MCTRTSIREESHPEIPIIFVHTIGLCALVGVWVRRNNGVPQSKSTSAVQRGEWKGCEERGGLGGIQVYVAFPFKGYVGRPSEQNRHAITSPTNIVLHQLHTDNADGGAGREHREGNCKQKNFSDWGGGVEERWSSHCKGDGGLTCHSLYNADETHAISQAQTQ